MPPASLVLATSLLGDLQAELDRALPFARALGLNVLLLHTVRDPIATYGDLSATAIADVEMAIREAMEEAEGILAAAASGVSDPKVQVSYEVKRGEPRSVILETARDQGARLLAVHPEEHSAAEKFLLGTTSRYLLQHAEIPVLLLRAPPYPQSADGDIVVPIEPAAPERLPKTDTLGALALGLPARLHFVSVLDLDDLLKGRAREQCHQAARSGMDALLSRRAASPLGERQDLGEVVYARRAWEGIVKYAFQVSASLIALQSHGASGTGRALLGSVCDQVASRAPCSVLVFPHRPG